MGADPGPPERVCGVEQGAKGGAAVMDEKRLVEIEARAAKATPGPWEVQGQGGIHMDGTRDWYDVRVEDRLIRMVPTKADALFIAHSREDVPALCAEVRAAMIRNVNLSLQLSKAWRERDEAQTKLTEWQQVGDAIMEAVTGKPGPLSDSDVIGEFRRLEAQCTVMRNALEAVLVAFDGTVRDAICRDPEEDEAIERVRAALSSDAGKALAERVGALDSLETLERLANLAHEQWSGWMQYLFEKSTKNQDGTVTIPAWAVERWQRQVATPYADLSEQEKESDRREARRVITVLKEAKYNG